jgi:hypothetical protein
LVQRVYSINQPGVRRPFEAFPWIFEKLRA